MSSQDDDMLTVATMSPWEEGSTFIYFIAEESEG